MWCKKKQFVDVHLVKTLFIRGGRYRKRKRRGVDYSEEIPFEKKPPPGNHISLLNELLQYT